MMRYDITTNDWVIYAPDRARRPEDFRRGPGGAGARPGDAGASEGAGLAGRPPARCPFCPGNESLTPPEVYAARDRGGANGPGWRVRAFPNRFPALRIEESLERVSDSPLFGSMGSCGAHEVIVESPAHDAFLGDQPGEHVETLLRVLQLRHQDLMRDARFQTIMIFKNHGAAAGTSLRHPHWQLIATPVVPHMLRIKYEIATRYFDQFGACLYCDVLARERAAGTRLLAENGNFAAVLPYASRLPFEIWILPRAHQTSFGRMDPALLAPLAALLKLVLRTLHAGLADPAFNITVNSAPRGEEEHEYFLWHLQILPRLTLPAGFELGSGMSINTVFPEDAADYLRRLTGA